MMKRIFIPGLFLCVLSFPSISLGATVGNIANTQGDLGKFSLGLEYDGVVNRDMKWKNGSQIMVYNSIVVGSELVPTPGTSIEDFKVDSTRTFIKGTLGFNPYVDIFAKVGVAAANYEGMVKEPGIPDKLLEFKDDLAFAWGIGAKVKLFETSGGLRFMADAQYLSYKVNGDSIIGGKDIDQDFLEGMMWDDPNATFSSQSEIEIKEWQVAMYVSQTFGNFAPYAGVKYSDFKMDFESVGSGQYRGLPVFRTIEGDCEGDNNFGIFVGTDIYMIHNRLCLNIEGRFIDETAYTIALNYKFF